MPLEEAYLALLRSVGSLYRRRVPPSPEARAMLASAAEILGRISSVERHPVPHRLPACRHLGQALAPGGGADTQAVWQAFQALEPELTWRQNPNYGDEKLGPGYMDNYAYCAFVGPQGLAGGKLLAVGILLLGPERLYPDHNHAAAEIYHVLCGTARWRRAKSAWEQRSPGSCVYHSPWEAHAIQTATGSLLALYCWYGDLDSHASLI